MSSKKVFKPGDRVLVRTRDEDKGWSGTVRWAGKTILHVQQDSDGLVDCEVKPKSVFMQPEPIPMDEAGREE